MGNCCPKSAASSGIDEPLLHPTLGSDFEEGKALTEEQLKRLTTSVVFAGYRKDIERRRRLQAQRAKIVKGGLSEEYLRLARETSELEKTCCSAAEVEVLGKLKVTKEEYEKAKESFSGILGAAMEGVMRAIREGKNLSRAKALDLAHKYQQAYDEANFVLNSKPENARKLSDIYEGNDLIGYVDLFVADKLYNEFKMLPIEVHAFISEHEQAK
eukprot:TRINITY_DN5701_c0_g1_i11.p1 TRINITY_DN5701_c0_g1~~TRINITY_DN5701_c0_g1_i11.p1  ORF type:complete len:214 (-),score=80.73 TRINITY_DN5701_c0_g1_i11:96-737(-)